MFSPAPNQLYQQQQIQELHNTLYLDDDEDEHGHNSEEDDDEEAEEDEDEDDGAASVGPKSGACKKKKKDKKLVFLSRSVLQKIRERPMTTGTQIAIEILELYKQFSNVRRHLLKLISHRRWTSRTCKGVSTTRSTSSTQ